MSLPSAKKLLLAVTPRYVQQQTDTLPAMTANNSPAGHVALGSQDENGFGNQPFRVFNKTTQSAVAADYVWEPNTGWVQRQTPAPIRLWRFGIRYRIGVTDQAPRDFRLLGSNDGVNFTLLRAVTGQVGWSDNETRLFEIPKLARRAFAFHRLQIDANNGSSATAIEELLFFQEVRA